eukprot:scaffold2773_cov119-Skeletonema_dohrnii-CCMP3373.AAC.12
MRANKAGTNVEGCDDDVTPTSPTNTAHTMSDRNSHTTYLSSLFPFPFQSRSFPSLLALILVAAQKC